jgi:RimJ/RimL family protein N-acetyltransferase
MERLADAGLVLEPLEVKHAEVMYRILSDPELHRYMDDPPPPSLDALRERYRSLERRTSPDGLQGWLNWIVAPADGEPIGFVQSTVEGTTAWIAYLLARPAWGRGHATRACHLMIDHLIARYGVQRFMAVAEVANRPSIRLLERLGFALAGDTANVTLTPSERLFVRLEGKIPSRP